MRKSRRKYKQLTKEQAKEIRWMYKHTNKNQSAIAKKFNVGQSCIHHIIYNQTHFDPEYIPPAPHTPINREFCRKLRTECKFTFPKIAILEAEHMKRQVPFNCEWVRKCCNHKADFEVE